MITTTGIGFSVIAPPVYLEHFVAQEPARVHHVAAQHVLSDEIYRAFFAREAERGAEIVVDNGLFDLGYALPAESLVEAALAVSAREIILPDVMRDGAATLKASEKAAREIRELSGDAFRLCAVLHAADDDEWLRTYDAFVTSDWAGAIALPASRRPDPDEQLCRTRWLATAYLQDHGLVDDLLVYRLLGLGRTGHLELIEQREHEWISSVDGAAPVILGAMGVALLPEGPYEKPSTPRIEKLGPIPEDRFDLIRENICVVRAAAGSTVTIAEEHR
ncbi:hypothetical protein OG894_04925 [Streptomyces sp. NBC_01724]|uniref:hypothetical protein n=1 Tax=unclassified Streptomyces TaxID=2593676 RepID=UPI002E381C73|nr:hypothetical protein [Streptomyces sp. NBC_01724]WTE55979.1 hypothetical protein OG987_37795 [Streptomyces sp. NBC_01620]WTE64053.1 hypothetical protein OG784_37535 [Streptomyces sp. NBC_01617]WTI91336.1 hypothetical protein OHB17_36855 [Streptomyces sp. NBC_00724]